nr:methylenetetrahydrofolate reductase [Candidatus Sigynarchaeota archaeon]
MVKQAFSNLKKALVEGKFVFTGELEPKFSTEIEEVISDANSMKDFVIAANVTDNPASDTGFVSIVASYLTQQATGLEMIWQLRCTDKNRMALIADLLAAPRLGLKNVLALTGDHPWCSPNWRKSKPVYDLDSTTLIRLVNEMVEKKTAFGKEIAGPPVELNVGGAANPNAGPLEAEILKLKRKAKVGCDWFQTQVVYDLQKTLDFLKEVNQFGVPVLIGLFPMKSYDVAYGFNMMVPGVKVPDDLLARFKQVKTEWKNVDKKRMEQEYLKLNVEYFGPFITELYKKRASAGIHIMAVHYADAFKPLLEYLKK